MQSDKRIIMKVRNISKRFVNIEALKNVNIDVYQSEIHGLVGENGAGKSTLGKIIVGNEKKDSGEIYFNDNLYEPKSIIDGILKKVGMVFQESNLIPCLSVAENLFMGDLKQFKRNGLIRWKDLYRKASDILRNNELDLDPKVIVSELDFGRRKLVEFIHIINYNPEIIIIDEVTACLNRDQVTLLFKWIKKLTQEGKSLIYISHRMEEVFNICDVITILKDGKVVELVDPKMINIDQLSSLTVGRNVQGSYMLYEKQKQNIKVSNQLMLEVKNLSKKNMYNDVSFNLLKGEIIGFAGLEGSGTEEVIKSLFGLNLPDEGEIKINGKLYSPFNVQVAMENGLGYIPKERETEGLINIFSVKNNLSLAILKKLKHWWLFLDKKQEDNVAKKYKKEMNIKCNNIDTYVMNLSGGNKQKVVIAKWLATDASILLLNNPTRGVDVGVKFDIYNLIFQIVSKGISIVLVSDELPEIIRLSHRIITMFRGTISGEYNQYKKMVLEEDIIKTMI